MKNILAILAIGLLPLTAAAHGPSPQKVEKTVVIDASPDKVWGLVKDFGNWQKWHPAVESTKLDKRKNDSGEEETTRLLNLKGGGTILENLKSIDEGSKQMKYGIIEGVLPVADYYSTISVKAVDGGKSEVKWMGRFYRVYKLNPPIPPGQDDKSALDAVNGVYDTGLANLKKVAEGK